MAKMSASSVVCSVGVTSSWLARLTSSPSSWRSTSGPLTPAHHTTSSDGHDIAAAQHDAVGAHLADLGAGAHVDAELPQQRQRRVRDARRQRRQDALGRLDQDDADVASGSTRSRPKATTWRAVWCSSAASSVPVAPAPMIATWSWPGADRRLLGIGADAGIDQAVVEAHRLLRRLQRHGVARARRACRNHW